MYFAYSHNLLLSENILLPPGKRFYCISLRILTVSLVELYTYLRWEQAVSASAFTECSVVRNNDKQLI